MRTATQVALTLTAAALFMGGLGAVALVGAVKETGRVVSFGLKHTYTAPIVMQVNRQAKGDRQPIRSLSPQQAEQRQYHGPHFGFGQSRIL